MIDRPHLLQAEFREVIVGRDQMHAFARQRIQIEGQGSDQRLTFTRFHFGDLALVEHDPADQLHVKMALADSPDGGFTHERERLRQNIIQRFALCQPRFKFVGFGAQLIVAERLHFRFQGVDLFHDFTVTVEFALIGIAEHRFYDGSEHVFLTIRSGSGYENYPLILPAFIPAICELLKLSGNYNIFRSGADSPLERETAIGRCANRALSRSASPPISPSLAMPERGSEGVEAGLG